MNGNMRIKVAVASFFLLLSWAWPARPAETTSGWQAEWDKIVAAAHREGELTVYGQARYPTSSAIRAFAQAYPRIKLHFMGGTGSQIGVRVMAEKRANKHLVDIAVGGAGTQVQVYYKAGLLEPMSAVFILPEIKDGSFWWEKRHHYADPEERYVFVMTADVSSNIGVTNTNLVRPGEIQSWWDLLSPKWRAKIVATDPKSAGNIGTWRFLYYSPDLGPKFLRRLFGEMDVKFSVDERQMMDWVGSGKYAIHLLAKGPNIERAREQGLPVQELLSQKEGGSLSAGSSHLSFFKNAPHPNAARVYINWILSREGQLTWQKLTQDNSLRMDIPKDMVPKEQIPKEGLKYIMTSHPRYEDVRPLRQLVDEVLAEARKR